MTSQNVTGIATVLRTVLDSDPADELAARLDAAGFARLGTTASEFELGSLPEGAIIRISVCGRPITFLCLQRSLWFNLCDEDALNSESYMVLRDSDDGIATIIHDPSDFVLPSI